MCVLCSIVSLYFFILWKHSGFLNVPPSLLNVPPAPPPHCWLATIFVAAYPHFLSFLVQQLKENVALSESGAIYVNIYERCFVYSLCYRASTKLKVLSLFSTVGRHLINSLLHFRSGGCAAVFCVPHSKESAISMGKHCHLLTLGGISSKAL